MIYRGDEWDLPGADLLDGRAALGGDGKVELNRLELVKVVGDIGKQTALIDRVPQRKPRGARRIGGNEREVAVESHVQQPSRCERSFDLPLPTLS